MTNPRDDAGFDDTRLWRGGLAGPSLLTQLDECGRSIRYLAAPVGVYGTARYVRVVTRLAAAGDEFVLGAAGLYSSTPHWVAWWPSILERVAAVSVLGAPDGTIGRGVYIEACDAEKRGCAFRWEGPGRRHNITMADFVIVDGGASLRRYATLRPKARPR